MVGGVETGSGLTEVLGEQVDQEKANVQTELKEMQVAYLKDELVKLGQSTTGLDQIEDLVTRLAYLRVQRTAEGQG